LLPALAPCYCPAITLVVALPLHLVALPSHLVAALPSHLIALPSRLVATLPSHLAPSFFRYLLALPPIVVLLPYYSIVAPCCSALLVDTPSSLSCAGGGTWNNTNKLHPTKVFFF